MSVTGGEIVEARVGHGGRLGRGSIFIEGEGVARHEAAGSHRRVLRRSVPLAHFDVAVHGAVRMAVLAGRHVQAGFGAPSGEAAVLACH